MEGIHTATGIGTNLSPYLRAIRAYPMLTAETEQRLCARWRENHDLAAAHQLVASHLRLVVTVARKYRGYGLPSEDLISEGHVGLMRAVCRFDPNRGFRFATYAIWWIRAAMQEYIVHNWSLVRVGTTASQKKLFFNLRRLRSQLDEVDGGELQPEHATKIAGILNVPYNDVISMNQRMAGGDWSLNTPISEERDGEWQELLVDDTDDQEAALAEQEQVDQRRHMLDSALGELTARERAIVVERRLRERPASLKDLSQSYGLSCERIRQIELQALTKLRRTIAVSAAQN